MKPWMMFTKHLEGYDLDQIMDGLHRAGVDGADLCVRPGYPVNPDNAAIELPKAARRFEENSLCIPLVTTPGDFVEADGEAECLFSACGDAGVKFLKLGYWFMEEDGYWASIDRCRRRLEAFASIAEKTGVKALIHNHSGGSLGLNSSSVMNLVKGFDPAYVGVYADVGHLSLVGEPYPLAFDIIKEYVAAVAFKDLVRERVQVDGKTTWSLDVVPLGRGLGDFPLVLDLLASMNFSGPISFHCEYSRLTPESVIDQCRMDTRFIKGLI